MLRLASIQPKIDLPNVGLPTDPATSDLSPRTSGAQKQPYGLLRWLPDRVAFGMRSGGLPSSMLRGGGLLRWLRRRLRVERDHEGNLGLRSISTISPECTNFASTRRKKRVFVD